MEIIVKKFSELSCDELYEIVKSRAEVFLLEQNIICQDLDDVDKKSLHCFFFDGKRVTAYLRAYPVDIDTVAVGRVLTLEHGRGIGSELMRKSIAEIEKHFGAKKITTHAQKQAFRFYEKLGFKIVSDEFLEEGIVHVIMDREI